MISPDDGRVMFILPAGKFTIVGTTDSWTDDPPDEARASETDLVYLLRAVEAYFPDTALTEMDVVSAWAGIRPLAEPDGNRNPSELSREHKITKTGAGMINVTGGKLTTYRSMAAEIVDCVEDELGRKPSKCLTADQELAGAERPAHLEKLIAEHPALKTLVINGLPYTFAELMYGVSNEMALTLSDLLMRRTRVAFETPDHGLSAVTRIAENVAEFAGWDKYQKKAQVEAYTDEVARVFSVDP